MKLTLTDQLTQFMRVMQGALFPALQEELEPLTEKHRQLVALLNMLRIEVLIGCWQGRGEARERSPCHCPCLCGQGGVEYEHDAAVVGTVGSRHGVTADLRMGERA